MEEPEEEFEQQPRHHPGKGSLSAHLVIPNFLPQHPAQNHV